MFVFILLIASKHILGCDIKIGDDHFLHPMQLTILNSPSIHLTLYKDLSLYSVVKYAKK